ncbi:MAG: kinase [Limnobacter sp.]|nr:kinase [Limnobacter sp.]
MAPPPVPVFWLLGKTGAGKTSLIRALTGATEAEIGNGYVPCTRNSVVYDFPPDDPAMRFMDTRGLGEVGYDPADDLAACESATHLLLVLARLDDPVQGPVAEALARIRRGRRMPVLVLHTAADCGSSDERARARAATQAHFDAAWGQPLPWLELSLATPETADLDALTAQLQAMLPGVVMLLERQKAVDAEDAEFQANRGFILRYTAAAAAAGGLPLVGAASVPALQATMLAALAARYRIDWTRRKLAAFLGALGTGVLGGQAVALLGRELALLIPGIGQTVGPVLSASWGLASTYALGRAAAYWMYRTREGLRIDEGELRSRYEAAFKRGRDASS